MARAYSIDLRERVLAASESGEGSQTELAKQALSHRRANPLALAAHGPHGGPP